MSELKMEKLSKQQVKELYETNMQTDFPADEIKPLEMLLKAMDKGNYDALGLVEEGKIRAYAFFFKVDKDYLFDYLAVSGGKRNQGLGTQFLEQIRAYYKNADSIIGEVEDPEYAKTEADRSMQERRIGFYLRNDCLDTGVKVQLYGVNYKVFELKLGEQHTQEQIKALYKKLYKAMFSRLDYRKYVRVK